VGSSRLPAAYPTKSKTELVNLELRGWQSFGGLPLLMIIYAVYLSLFQVLLITHIWSPELLLLLHLHPSCLHYQRFLL
jgi:hypothetical protein